MTWFWRKGKRTPCQLPRRSEDALNALERAEHSQVEAEKALEEMKQRSERSKRRREENHFAPLIWREFGGE